MNEKSASDIPRDQYELYAEFGMIAEKAQVLEMEAGNVALFFLAIFVDKDKDKITPEMKEIFRSVVNDVNSKTFGALITQLKKMMSFDDSILTIINDALERRNYLPHRFFSNTQFRSI